MFLAFSLSSNAATYRFKLIDIKKKSIYRALGLKNGDVLVGVNNKAFKGGDDFKESFVSAIKSKKFSLQVVRNSKDVTLDYNLK